MTSEILAHSSQLSRNEEAYPAHKAARYDLASLADNRQFVLDSWGEEAVAEFFLHVAEDLLMQEIVILRQAGCPDEAVDHSVEVARKALEIASRVKSPVNRRLLARCAVFHDLGKAKTSGMEHGEIGAKMAEELGLEEEIRQIILKHIRGGRTEPEARELGVPVRDYTLRTPEEKIVIYADRLVDIYTTVSCRTPMNGRPRPGSPRFSRPIKNMARMRPPLNVI